MYNKKKLTLEEIRSAAFAESSFMWGEVEELENLHLGLDMYRERWDVEKL